MSQLGLRRGGPAPHVTHGFYAANLTPSEAREASEMETGFRTAYDLDGPADTLLLQHLCRAAVLAARALPDADSERAQNILGARVRLVSDLLDRLALSRRERRKGEDTDAVRRLEAVAALAAIVKRSKEPGGP